MTCKTWQEKGPGELLGRSSFLTSDWEDRDKAIQVRFLSSIETGEDVSGTSAGTTSTGCLGCRKGEYGLAR